MEILSECLLDLAQIIEIYVKNAYKTQKNIRTKSERINYQTETEEPKDLNRVSIVQVLPSVRHTNFGDQLVPIESKIEIKEDVIEGKSLLDAKTSKKTVGSKGGFRIGLSKILQIFTIATTATGEINFSTTSGSSYTTLTDNKHSSGTNSSHTCKREVSARHSGVLSAKKVITTITQESIVRVKISGDVTFRSESNVPKVMPVGDVIEFVKKFLNSLSEETAKMVENGKNEEGIYVFTKAFTSTATDVSVDFQYKEEPIEGHIQDKEELKEEIKKKDAQIEEKDGQIEEKDAQIEHMKKMQEEATGKKETTKMSADEVSKKVSLKLLNEALLAFDCKASNLILSFEHGGCVSETLMKWNEEIRKEHEKVQNLIQAAEAKKRELENSLELCSKFVALVPGVFAMGSPSIGVDTARSPTLSEMKKLDKMVGLCDNECSDYKYDLHACPNTTLLSSVVSEDSSSSSSLSSSLSSSSDSSSSGSSISCTSTSASSSE